MNHLLASDRCAESVDWLGDRSMRLARGHHRWRSGLHFGMNVLDIYFGLTTIPPEMIEAARVDGASLRQITWRVIVPILQPTIEFIAVITSITIRISMFGLIYVMTSGGARFGDLHAASPDPADAG